MKTSLVVTAILGLGAVVADDQWQRQTFASDANLRGLCAVSAQVAWVSGTRGTYGRTTDGGKTWSVGTVPGAAKLDFRDVEAFDAMTAYLMSAGPGEDSRIYKTTDGGQTWTLQFKNPDPDAFYDAIAFWDDKHGIALSDPVKGQFQLIATENGVDWQRFATDLPPALPKEGAFAASGTCLVTHGKNDVWFCTGGAKHARVFHSSDRGQNWTVTETPVLAGVESAGTFSLAFKDEKHGMVVGGDYRKPNEPGSNAAITADGGHTWTLLQSPLPYRSGVAWAGNRWIAVGTSGSNFSVDGMGWKLLDQENYNSVAFTPTGEGWAVGPKGRIVKFAN